MTREGSKAEKLAVPPLLEADTFLGLSTTFLSAVNAFNRQEVRKIEEALADNAILYKVTNGTPVSGKAAVMEYPRNEGHDGQTGICARHDHAASAEFANVRARRRLLEEQRQGNREHTLSSLRIPFPVSCSIPDYVDVGDTRLISRRWGCRPSSSSSRPATQTSDIF